MNTTANEMSTTHQAQGTNHQTLTQNFKLDAALALQANSGARRDNCSLTGNNNTIPDHVR